MTKEESKTEWVKLKPKEVESLIVDLAKQGHSPERIGLVLRDKHGVSKSKAHTGKRIKKILDESNSSYKKEKEIIEERIENLKKHFKLNKHDYSSQRALAKALWAVRRA